MSKHPLAIVCALAFAVGAAAAGVLYYSPREGSAVRGVAENIPDFSGAVAAVAGRPDEEARAEQRETASEAEVKAEVDGGEGRKTAAGVRGRATTGGPGGKRQRAATGYVRVSAGRAETGGRGVAGHAVGGMRKTGSLLGRGLKKVGGVFHD